MCFVAIPSDDKSKLFMNIFSINVYIYSLLRVYNVHDHDSWLEDIIKV